LIEFDKPNSHHFIEPKEVFIREIKNYNAKLLKRQRKEKLKKMEKQIKTQQENPNGLYNRYIVSKVSGEPVDKNADYFVLRLDEYGDDLEHIAACRKAIMTYAEEIKNHLPQLSADIIERYGK